MCITPNSSRAVWTGPSSPSTWTSWASSRSSNGPGGIAVSSPSSPPSSPQASRRTAIAAQARRVDFIPRRYPGSGRVATVAYLAVVVALGLEVALGLAGLGGREAEIGLGELVDAGGAEADRRGGLGA